MLDKKKYKESTIITHAGQESGEHFGFVNTPVYRGSTVLSETSKEFRERSSRYFYGSKSNPNRVSFRRYKAIRKCRRMPNNKFRENSNPSQFAQHP